MKGINLGGHFSLESTQSVNEICSSILQQIGITYFNYLKVYHKDSSRELLTNNAEWIDHFYKTGLYNSVATIDVEHLLPKGYFLWSELDSNDPIYNQGRELFNIDNGISFIVKRKDVTCLYIFGSTRENYKINNFYIKNIDLLKRFILYFNDKGSTLLKNAAKNKIYLPEKQIITPKILNNMEVTQSEREIFYEKTNIEKFYLLTEADDLYLTKKQAECAAYLIEGATAKQCAKALNISYRTVESYINDIKTKLFEFSGTKLSKDELVGFLKNTAIHDAVFPGKIELFT